MQPDDSKNIINNLSKLHWACRRGMLELDILLNNFLDEAYGKLASEDKMRFVGLLSSTDPELFAWLMGHETPEDPELKSIVERVRQHARSRV